MFKCIRGGYRSRVIVIEGVPRSIHQSRSISRTIDHPEILERAQDNRYLTPVERGGKGAIRWRRSGEKTVLIMEMDHNNGASPSRDLALFLRNRKERSREGEIFIAHAKRGASWTRP